MNITDWLLSTLSNQGNRLFIVCFLTLVFTLTGSVRFSDIPINLVGNEIHVSHTYLPYALGAYCIYVLVFRFIKRINPGNLGDMIPSFLYLQFVFDFDGQQRALRRFKFPAVWRDTKVYTSKDNAGTYVKDCEATIRVLDHYISSELPNGFFYGDDWIETEVKLHLRKEYGLNNRGTTRLSGFGFISNRRSYASTLFLIRVADGRPENVMRQTENLVSSIKNGIPFTITLN